MAVAGQGVEQIHINYLGHPKNPARKRVATRQGSKYGQTDQPCLRFLLTKQQ